MSSFLPGMEAFDTPQEPVLEDLAAAFDRAVFFDIETEGLEHDADITMISSLSGSDLRAFVKDENIDGFLAVLESAPLLVSFNGTSFDVPHILRRFHIPSLPCPHLDLRRVCKARGISGGLKKIERAVGILRPPDVLGVTGEDACWMWTAWRKDGDRSFRDRLVRYCMADAVALRLLALHLLNRPADPAPWAVLNASNTAPAPGGEAPVAAPATVDAAYERLREHHRQRASRSPAAREFGI